MSDEAHEESESYQRVREDGVSTNCRDTRYKTSGYGIIIVSHY